MNMEIKARLFSIDYDGHSVVSVFQKDNGDFDKALDIIDDILGCFRMSKPGSIWGCDGIGYLAQKDAGIAFRKKSGVGRIKYQQGLEKVKGLQ